MRKMLLAAFAVALALAGSTLIADDKEPPKKAVETYGMRVVVKGMT